MARDDATPNLSARLLADPAATAWLSRHLSGRPTAAETVQSLWSGYGEIVRVRITGGDVPSVIVKWVEPPPTSTHPRGWAGAASHDRKLRSYAVERCFYAKWRTHCTDSHRTARCYAAESTGNGWRFLLEDLDASGFPGRHRHLAPAQLDDCLHWLASFHARFLGRQPVGLWPIGTYWHLATRQEELAALSDPALRTAASRLDAALNRCRYPTLVHGDAKVANFCFGAGAVAAVDFQYVGGGCGIKDVAYFLSSCLSEAECEAEAPRHLDTYFAHLRRHLDPAIDADAVVTEWRRLYPAAWADFHRFLAGWAPRHWKIHGYTRRMTAQALAML